MKKFLLIFLAVAAVLALAGGAFRYGRVVEAQEPVGPTVRGDWYLKSNLDFLSFEEEEKVEFTLLLEATENSEEVLYECEALVNPDGKSIQGRVKDRETLVPIYVDGELLFNKISFGDKEQRVSEDFSEWLKLNGYCWGDYTISGVREIDYELLMADAAKMPDEEIRGTVGPFEIDRIWWNSASLCYGMGSEELEVKSSDGWTDSGYRQIDFGKVPQSVSYEFYSWMMEFSSECVLLKGSYELFDLAGLPCEAESHIYVPFISNGKLFSGFFVTVDNTDGIFYVHFILDLGEEMVQVYSYGEWMSDTDGYRVVNFGHKGQYVTQEFYDFIQEYADPYYEE